MQMVSEGELPSNPTEDVMVQGFDDAMWDFMACCCAMAPLQRPSATEVVTYLRFLMQFRKDALYTGVVPAPRFRSNHSTFTSVSIADVTASSGPEPTPQSYTGHSDSASPPNLNRELSTDSLSSMSYV